MPRKTAEAVLARSGSSWQKEVGPGAYVADARQGNRIAVTAAIRQIVRKEGCSTTFTLARSENKVKGVAFEAETET